MKVTGRELSIGVIVLAFIGGAYVLSQYTGERGRMIRIGYSFFAEEGWAGSLRKTGGGHAQFQV